MARVHRGNRDLMREMNRSLVLNLIKSQGPVSRTTIADLSELSLATVSSIVADLIESGLVEEVGVGESTGGRKPVLLVLNPRAGFVVGLKLMEHAITSAVTDLDATVLHHRITPLRGRHEPTAVIPIIIRAIEQTLQNSQVERTRVLGIGIGMPGVVNGETGVCRYSPFFQWRDVNIAEPIEAHFGLPVYLDNDVNTLTIAEQWFGYGHGVDHFVVVTVGRGIGAGIVVNGQFYRGAIGGAGELGHIAVTEDGPLCACGKRGCLEAVAADPAVLRLVREAIAAGRRTTLPAGPELDIEMVSRAAAAGDDLAREVLAQTGRAFGRGIASLINILNPHLVIVGGEGVRAGPWRLEPMTQAIREHAFNGLADELQIVIEPAGDETWARGAAAVVLGEIFKSPIHRTESLSLVGAKT